MLFNTDAGRALLARKGVARRRHRRARPLRVLVDLQRARRDQDGQAPRPRAGRRDHHGGHRRRRRCTRASGPSCWRRALRRRRSPTVDAAEVVRPAPRRRRHRRHHRLHRRATARGSSTSATTPGSSSRARRSSCSSSAVSQSFWRGLRRYLGVWDEMITEFNARVGRRDRRLALRRVRHGPSTSPRRPRVHVPARDADRSATTCCTRWTVGASSPSRSTTPTRSCASARASRGGRSPAPHGMTEAACVGPDPRTLADGFTVTPFARSPSLSGAIGADVWVKDETGNVGGSHKGRHLVTILLHLVAAESLRARRPGSRPPLAIASCGNAAIAAATLAPAGRRGRSTCSCRRGRRPEVLGLLESLGARDPPVPAAARPTRRATRPCCASARPSPPAPCRSACRARRTRCASTAGARSGGRSPTAGVGLDRVLVQVGGGALRGVHRMGARPRRAARRRADRRAARRWPER